ncbi:MFS transporter [Solidesulfovibrio sp.]
METQSPPAGSLLLRSFRHRNFRLFFAGQFISLTGTWMQSVAVSWLVYRLTGSSMALGLVGFASHIPVFVFGLFGGCLADRGNKRAILIIAQIAAMGQALALAALTLSGAANIWLIVGLAMVLGLVNAVDMPTRQAFVVDMVGREDLHNAIALNSSMFNSARVVGPALAGLLVAAIGEGWCFLVNGLSYLAVIAALAAMRLPPSSPAAGCGSVSGHVGQGLAFAWRDGRIRSILGSLVVASLFASSYMVLLPVMVNTVLGHGAQALGFLMAATGAGSVVAALVLALRRESRGLARWRIVSGLGVGLAMLAFAFSQIFWLSVLLSAILGFCLIFFFAASNTLLQLRSPDAMRGRIMALYSVTLVGMAPFGSLLAGAAASLLTAPAAIALAGGLCVLGVGLSTILGRVGGGSSPAV